MNRTLKSWLISLLICTCFWPQISAQSPSVCLQVVSGGGGHANTADKVFDYTIGETLTFTISGPAISITQGFQQPSTCLLVNISHIDWLEEWGLKIYPNPVHTELTLEVNSQQENSLEIMLTNTSGRPITGIRQWSANTKTAIDCTFLPAGAYMVMIRKKQSLQWHSIPFVKN